MRSRVCIPTAQNVPYAEGKQGQEQGLLVSPLVDRSQDGVQHILGEMGMWSACVVNAAARCLPQGVQEPHKGQRFRKVLSPSLHVTGAGGACDRCWWCMCQVLVVHVTGAGGARDRHL